MRLNKSDALLLSKVLFHYEKMIAYDKDDLLLEEVCDLSDRLSEFLTDVPHRGEDDDLGDESCSDCGGDHDSGHHDDDEEDDEEDDDSDEDKLHPHPKHSKVIASDKLHELPEANVFEGGNPVSDSEKVCSLEFETFEDGDSYLLLNGGIYHDDNVAFLRREGKLIEFWCSSGAKFMFTFKKLHKEWKTLLEDNVVYMVD
jgi:hypothetical protein